MRKIFLFIAGIILTTSMNLRADEGMWLLPLIQKLNMDEMKELGLELSAEEIYSINNSSLKDAIGALDNGSCTAELVSGEGLLFTNHHCGYGEIQSHSSIEHDYLKNGFWAMTKDEELPNPGKSVSFLVKLEDITDQILPLLSSDLTGIARSQKLETISEEIVNNAVKDTHYEGFVRPFFNGNRYYLVIMETFLDVRLVGAPPESIGKFGHDSDNWMWPRHTGDFAIFRVYTGPDGKPAEYSPDNVPLNPKHFLPVSLEGYEKGDFAMVMGFPGSTNRYMTSYEVTELLDVEHPNRIKIRGIKQEIMMEDMMSSDVVRIQYSSKYSRSSNYWKYSIGQSEGLRNLNIVDRKQDQQLEFTAWVNEDEERKQKYGETLEMIRNGVEGREDLEHTFQYLWECMYMGMETIPFALRFRELFEVLGTEEPDTEKVKTISENLQKGLSEMYKDYNLETDKKITKAMIELMLEDVPDKYQDENLLEVKSKYSGKIDKYVDKYFKKSIFPYEDEVEKFLEDPSLKKLEKDPAFVQMLSFLSTYYNLMSNKMEYDNMVEKGRRLWIDGLMKMQPEKDFYPDANSTIRLTYGTVGDYKAKDAVYYSHFTTLEGVMEKEDPDNMEFIVSEKLKELYRKKDYGPYSENGTMHVCFTTNNDITGGNSGSPVLNKKGELIGIAFDGNWEAMSGDIAFEHELQKCINVDIRYVLFIIDKYAGAKHLIEEMKIVN